RSFHDLFEVLGERSATPLLFRSRAGGGPGTLAKARANPGEAKWIFHSWPQMGPEETSHCCVDCSVGCFSSSHRLEYLGKRTNQPSRDKGDRGAAIRKPQPRSGQRLLCRRRARRNSN